MNGYSKHIIECNTLHLYEIKSVPSNYQKYLLPDELNRLFQFNSEIRKQEYIATRVLRTFLFGRLPFHYSPNGAPSIESVSNISISHSCTQVGLACCDDFPIGLDIEPIREKVLRVKHKFLSKEEKQVFDTSSVEEMTRVWSAKEALYKLAGRKGIIFSDSLLLEKVEKDMLKGRICFPQFEKSTMIHSVRMGDEIISINKEPLKSKRPSYQ